MTGFDEYSAVLGDAAKYAEDWLTGLPTRRVPPTMNSDEVADAIGRSLPEGPTDPRAVIALLAQSAEPGLTAMGSPRFFGFVIGGATPAALAADWLTSTWDQNAGLRQVTPAAAALGDAAARWLLDLWGLPSGCSVGFVTGATMANFSGLAAARHRVLDRVGWNVGDQGLFSSPRIDVLVGDEVHESVVTALRYLGLGAPRRIAVDDQGRISLQALATALDGCAGPTIVVLQAGNIHSGAFDPFDDAIRLAHEHGAWVHIDGAFGLWAAASADLRELCDGFAAADSWATDAHKTLNVPYDSGVVVCADPAAHHSMKAAHGAYLVVDPAAADPMEYVPEFSRRAREIPVWAALRTLGRSGVADLVDRLCRLARRFADGIDQIDGAEVLNDVVYAQISVGFETDQIADDLVQRMLADGTAWLTGSRWHDRRIVRASMSNWATTDDDIDQTLDVLATQLADIRAGRPVPPRSRSNGRI